jgi:hypothetical protein
MSPEQARGEQADRRSDIYSAGVILYHMLVGRPPFEGDSAYFVAMKHITDPPLPPSQITAVDPGLEAVCLRALSKSPRDRFDNAREMRAALRAALARSTPAAERGRARGRRHRSRRSGEHVELLESAGLGRQGAAAARAHRRRRIDGARRRRGRVRGAIDVPERESGRAPAAPPDDAGRDAAAGAGPDRSWRRRTSPRAARAAVADRRHPDPPRKREGAGAHEAGPAPASSGPRAREAGSGLGRAGRRLDAARVRSRAATAAPPPAPHVPARACRAARAAHRRRARDGDDRRHHRDQRDPGLEHPRRARLAFRWCAAIATPCARAAWRPATATLRLRIDSGGYVTGAALQGAGVTPALKTCIEKGGDGDPDQGRRHR